MNRVMFGLGLLVALSLASGAGAAQPQTDGAAGRRAGTDETRKTSVVNLNSATVAELETLPGIGAKTAQRIVDYRQKNGGFKKIEELMNVKGVGEKSFLRIKDRLTVAAPRAEKPGTSAPA
jgi:competence protein ComEA